MGKKRQQTFILLIKIFSQTWGYSLAHSRHPQSIEEKDTERKRGRRRKRREGGREGRKAKKESKERYKRKRERGKREKGKKGRGGNTLK